ncbi:hypothetical protein ACE1SV_20060 [Streptomyces sennicomposti]
MVGQSRVKPWESFRHTAKPVSSSPATMTSSHAMCRPPCVVPRLRGRSGSVRLCTYRPGAGANNAKVTDRLATPHDAPGAWPPPRSPARSPRQSPSVRSRVASSRRSEYSRAGSACPSATHASSAQSGSS